MLIILAGCQPETRGLSFAAASLAAGNQSVALLLQMPLRLGPWCRAFCPRQATATRTQPLQRLGLGSWQDELWLSLTGARQGASDLLLSLSSAPSHQLAVGQGLQDFQGLLETWVGTAGEGNGEGAEVLPEPCSHPQGCCGHSKHQQDTGGMARQPAPSPPHCVCCLGPASTLAGLWPQPPPPSRPGYRDGHMCSLDIGLLE